MVKIVVRSLVGRTARDDHADIVAIEKNLGQRRLVALAVKLDHVLEHHVDVVIKSDERSAQL